MEKIIERWHDLIKINSINGHEVDVADYMAKTLRTFGIEPHYIYFEEDAEKKERPTVYGYLDSGKEGKTMMLAGHIDTVSVANGWVTDPFTPVEVGDRTYGLGAMDMKGGLAAILETLEYYANHKDEFTGKILVCLLSDEEGLSSGAYELAKHNIMADMAIMAECRYTNVAIGFRGRYSIEVRVHGLAAHASRYPIVGENAIITGAKLAEAIEELPTLTHPNLKHGTWCVRHIVGGNKATLVVPEYCDIFVDRYVVPGESYELCKKQIMEAAEKLNMADKIEVKLKDRKNPYMESFSLEPNEKLVVTLCEKFKEVTGEVLPYAYDPSVCDSNILAHDMGIPTVTFGPSGDGMHAANEFGHSYQVKNCAEIYKRVIKELLK